MGSIIKRGLAQNCISKILLLMDFYASRIFFLNLPSHIEPCDLSLSQSAFFYLQTQASALVQLQKNNKEVSELSRWVCCH